jgi:hypothetical protein
MAISVADEKSDLMALEQVSQRSVASQQSGRLAAAGPSSARRA